MLSWPPSPPPSGRLTETSLPPKPKAAAAGRFSQAGARCSGGGAPASRHGNVSAQEFHCHMLSLLALQSHSMWGI